MEIQNIEILIKRSEYLGHDGLQFKAFIQVDAKQWAKAKAKKGVNPVHCILTVAQNAIYRILDFPAYSPRVNTTNRAKKGVKTIEFVYLVEWTPEFGEKYGIAQFEFSPYVRFNLLEFDAGDLINVDFAKGKRLA